MSSPRAGSVKRLGAVFEQACDPIFLLDPLGRFSFVNRAWETLTGLDAEIVLGRAPADTGPRGLGLSPFTPLPESKMGLPASGKALIHRPDGERVWRRIEFWPYRDAHGQPLGTFGLVRDADAIPHAADSAAQKVRVALAEAREAMRIRYGHETVVGLGPRHDRLLAQIAATSLVESPALIVGEPGTGKRLVAGVIHARGARAASPFLAIDVAALSPDMLERELFGVDGTAGLLSAPAGATLFLGHVDRLPRDLQARLVATMADARVRLLGATTVDPELALNDERFRADFYFAMSVQVLRLAPLRERVDEVPLLAQHFLESFNGQEQSPVAAFSPAAIDVLRGYDWPGNLRELARVVAAAHARNSDPIRPDDLPAEIRGELASAYVAQPTKATITPLDQWLTRLERRLIEQALQRARQNKSRAADLLEISRPRLYRRIKELSIPDAADSPDDPNGRAE